MLSGKVKNLLEFRIAPEGPAATAASQREVAPTGLPGPQAVCSKEAILRESREERPMSQHFGPDEAMKVAGRSRIVRFPLCVLLGKGLVWLSHAGKLQKWQGRDTRSESPFLLC